MRLHAFSASLLLAVAWSCGGAPTVPSGDRSILINGTTRTYTLHVPVTFQRSIGALVVALHGAGDNGPSFERSSGLSSTADQAGFAVVYPDGLFNPRVSASDWEHFGDDFTDDIAFLRQLIAAVSRDIQSDSNRTYVAGFSDGGRLAHRAGVELSDLVAAIADVGGSLYQGAIVSVPPARAPVSVLILHGDADAYCGLPTDASQDQTFDYWAGASGDQCSRITPPASLCDDQGNVSDIVDKSGDICGSGTAVRLYRVIGGRHAWYGTTTGGVMTDDLIWAFFAAHPKR